MSNPTERPMTADEWQLLHDLCRTAAARETIKHGAYSVETGPGSLHEKLTTLGNKCATRATAAIEGRHIP